MMATCGNKQKWITAYEKEREYFAADPEPFKKWHRSWAPQGMADVQLQNGSEILYSGAGHAVADKFLHAAIDMVDRAFAEDKFRDPRVLEMSFPTNRGEALQVRAYAKSLLGGSLNENDLLQASRDYEEYWLRFGKSEWDSQTQAHILTAARMALIAGDLGRTKEVLAIKRSMKWHAEEFKLLKDLVQEAEFGLPIRDPALSERVRTLFDRIRDPDFNPDFYIDLPTARLEWGALINKYFETGGRINWERVIELVAE